VRLPGSLRRSDGARRTGLRVEHPDHGVSAGDGRQAAPAVSRAERCRLPADRCACASHLRDPRHTPPAAADTPDLGESNRGLLLSGVPTRLGRRTGTGLAPGQGRHLDVKTLEGTVVRRATPADAPRLAALSGEPGYPASPEDIERRLADLAGRADTLILVAELAPGDVVGWIHGSDQLLLESGRRCELAGLVVDPRARGRGVGRRLVAEVEAW